MVLTLEEEGDNFSLRLRLQDPYPWSEIFKETTSAPQSISETTLVDMED
jgi:hypothetical protein